MANGHQIYFVRHAIAEDRGQDYPDDSLRPLTSKGIARFRKVARRLAALDVSVDVILSSPFTRARQTADILAEALDRHPDVVETHAMEPEADFDSLRAALEPHRKAAAIALVGHNPSVGEFAARLIGLRTPIEFKKGGVCRIDVDSLPPAGPGRLRWLAIPRMLSVPER
jgi:phosphohistidine phosphatase